MESNSVPGKAVINHEAGDTLMRTITFKLAGTAINLTGVTQNFIVSLTPGGDAILTAAIGTGLIATDLVNGTVDLFKQTSGILERNREYFYRHVLTFPNGEIITPIEDSLLTPPKCTKKNTSCSHVTDNGTTVTISSTTITVDMTLRGPQGATGSVIASLDDITQGTTSKKLTTAQYNYLVNLIAAIPDINNIVTL